MAGLPVRKDHGLRPELADHRCEAKFVLTRGLDVRIGDAESATPFDGKELGGLGGFFGASFRGAASAHFTCGQVEDASLVAALRHFQERAAASEFDVVRMRGDGQYV